MAAAVESPPRSQVFSRFCNIMAKHPELCCFLVAIAFTLCTKYTQSQSRVLMAPQGHPRRFFSSTSPVIDFPYGNIGAVADLLQEQEILLVMYYAPWCAKSMRVQRQFEKAATYMQDEVTFVAINCWYEGGQCHEQNQFLSFPVLIAYHTTLDGFRYNGVLKADYLVDFMQQFLKPITRVTTKRELGIFLAERDHVVLGFFDFHASPQPPGYEQFYYAAIRTLEKDPGNVVRFGVITSPMLATILQMTESPTLALTMPFNDTLRYDASANFTSSAISKWVHSTKKKVRQSISWMLPSGDKSLALSSVVTKGPVIILFTQNAPLAQINQFHAMMREISLVYHNCDNSTRVQNVAESSVYVRWTAAKRHIEMLDTCLKLHERQKEKQEREESWRQHSLKPVVIQSCCTSVVPRGTPIITNACDVCIHYLPTHPLNSKHCPLTGYSNLPWHTLQNLSRCTELRASYNPTEYISTCCKHSKFSTYHRRVTSSIIQPGATRPGLFTDPYIEYIVKHREEDQCRHLRLQKTFGWFPHLHFTGLSLTPVDQSLTGLGCNTNQTLSFLSMDTKISSMFADRLGIDTSGNRTVAVLIHDEREVQYSLDMEVSKDNIASWLTNFTGGTLTRELHSTPVAPLKCDPSLSDVCIVELSTVTFNHIVMQEDKDVLVLYYAPWCGFCASFAHVYLSLARYFKSTKNLVFARINANANDLPWEFTVDSYPTLHFFPAHRKTESVSFADHLAKTLPNLLQFILRYATPELRLQTSLSICSRTCIHNNLQSSSQRIQELHVEIHNISKHLSDLNQKLESLQQGGVEEDSDLEHTKPVLKAKVDLIKDHTYLLLGQLRRRQLQLGSARHLHQALLTSQGLFIDKHKLTGIIKQHEKLHVPLTEVESQKDNLVDEPLEGEDQNIEHQLADRAENALNVHDEL